MEAGQKQPAAPVNGNGTSHFSFGIRRYASKGPRRLFVPQKAILSTVQDFGPERNRGLLRVNFA